MTAINFDALSRFAEFASRAAATTKRLEKAAFLAEYFVELDDENLSLAARYFAGQVFSLHDGRTANIGGAAILKAIEAVSGKDADELRTLLVRHGDFGDLAAEVMPSREPSLSLRNLSKFFDDISATKGSKAKLEKLIAFLEKADAAEAKYIVKLLSGDLRIGLQEGAVEDAIARANEVTVAEVQRTNMMLGDLGETAIRARHKTLGEVRMKLFHPLKFMLASPAADLTEVARQMPEEFAVEDKFDGIRAQAHIALVVDEEVGADETRRGEIINGVRVALFSRTLGEITHSFPDLLAPLAALVNSDTPAFLLDGEIVPIDLQATDDRVLLFQILQQRLNRKVLKPEFLEQIPVAFIAYDLLFAGEEIWLEKPFCERRKKLEVLGSVVQTERRFRVAHSVYFQDALKLDEEFEAARARGNEGLMVKSPASLYKPGRRGKDWLKIKRALATLDVVVTAVEVGNGRRNGVLSDYTFAVRAGEDDNTLLNVGKAYSGLTDAEIAEMSEWFRAHTIQEFAHGKVRTVEPKIVIEIAFDNVQVSPRHKSGYALRFPRIMRIREDKPASEIDTLETVRKLAEG